MNTIKLKSFAQKARKVLIEETTKKLDYIMHASTPEALEQKKILLRYGFGERGISTERQIRGSEQTKAEQIEKIAYTWFNRLCALRYMDMKGYTDCGIITEKEGFTQPEILTEAKNSTLPANLEHHTDMQTLQAILSGRTGVANCDEAAYRVLLKGACNYYHSIMPFMFEPINDYTEVLLMDDCLSENSLLADLKEALDEENCQNVEVIGWLYQYYISEKKDTVFEQVKKQRRKVQEAEIPAVTQLFTPHWIVRYLVENTLGRLWILNHPQSGLKEHMAFYIEPEGEEEPEREHKRDEPVIPIQSPEDIRICDPACGSGHMLTYTFDLLFRIYEEELYSPKDAVHAILNNNLKGFEVDERAGELAQFALFMKARERYSRFFKKSLTPDIHVFENISVSEDEITDFESKYGSLNTAFKELVGQMAHAKSFGSLINPHGVDITSQKGALEQIETRDLISASVKQRLMKCCEALEMLNQSYHAVVTNPPYLGNFDKEMGKFMTANYKDYKSDTFAAFMVRNAFFTQEKGFMGFMTPFVWMFISSFEKLRKFVLTKTSIDSFVRLEYTAFYSSAIVPVCTFILKNNSELSKKGIYISLTEFKGSENQAPKTLEAINDKKCKWRYEASSEDLKKIPGYPIAYWVSDRFRDLFKLEKKLGDVASPRQGMATSDNKRFLRFWQEVSINRVGFGFTSREEAQESGLKWFPYNKGGAFRKWYGNNVYLVNWGNDGSAIKKTVCIKYPYLNGNPDFVVKNQQFYFNEGITWSKVTSGKINTRFFKKGFLFDSGAIEAFHKNRNKLIELQSYLNCVLANEGLKFLTPTLNFTINELKQLPYKPITNPPTKQTIEETAQTLISLSKDDWDAYERSWDFKRHPLLAQDIQTHLLETGYKNLRQNWQAMTDQMKELEEVNNELFINHYGLVGELDKEVPLREISLTCNPHYRYPPNRSNPFDPKKAEKRLREDTVKELISYGVGCVFGRYSLDKDGLILASQGETVDDYLKQIPQPSFMPDEDNAVPILEENWFADDLYARLEEFLRVAFGAEHLRDNLAFIKKALGKDLQKYLLKDFIKDHVQTYNNRPIYWLFSSPKKYFNLLVYMHRYTSSTLSVVLKYLREFKDKVNAEIESYRNLSVNASDSAEKTRALKTLDKYSAIVRDLEEYENKTIFPLASERIEIDLDDGVAVNYPKFGDALFKIKGVNG